MLCKTLTTNSNLSPSPPTSFPPNLLQTIHLLPHLRPQGDYVLYHTFSQGGALRFFLLQAAGITFEDGVPSRLGNGCNGEKSIASKMIGYIWVFAWFTYSMPIWLNPQVHARTVDERTNFSLIRVLSARFSKS